ncbi:MAG: SDR family oxidoreductase [Ktedonobacterales bacterium]
MRDVILVIGATGHVGRHVVSQLLHTGATVRVVARNPDVAGMTGDVEVVRGDLTSPDTLDGHLDGVESVFLVWPGVTVQPHLPCSVI